jgi:steroid delta-isomerase-like uncharacterized protein
MSTTIRIAFIFLFFVACNQTESRAEKERKNLKTSLALVDAVWNNQDLTGLDTFFSDEFTREVNSIEDATNLVELTAMYKIYFSAFPDLHFTVEQLTPVDNQIFMIWNITGKNTGVFGDYPATGKKVQINGITKLDFDSKNKIVRQTLFYTELSLLQQLGHELDKPKTE